jgi:hypothetical protein
LRVAGSPPPCVTPKSVEFSRSGTTRHFPQGDFMRLAPTAPESGRLADQQDVVAGGHRASCSKVNFDSARAASASSSSAVFNRAAQIHGFPARSANSRYHAARFRSSSKSDIIRFRLGGNVRLMHQAARASQNAQAPRPRRRGDGDADRPPRAQHLRPVRHRQADRGTPRRNSVHSPSRGRTPALAPGDC